MRIDGLITGQALNQANISDILSRLNIGDVIKAKVLEMTSGELMLKLFDGTVFKAALTSEIDTKPGDLLELTVSGKSDGSITMETVKKNLKSETLQNEIKKLLISMEITPKPENIKLAVEFKAAGVKILPEVFEKAVEMLKKFSELSPEKAVFLAAKGIRPEEGRIDTLVKLLEGRLKLGKQLDDLQSVISSIEEGVTAGNKAEKPFVMPAEAVVAPIGTLNKAAIRPQETSKTALSTELRNLPIAAPAGEDVDVVNLISNIASLKSDGSNTGTDPTPMRKAVNETVSHAAHLTPVVTAAAELPEKVNLTDVTDDELKITKPDNEQTKESGLKILKDEAESLDKLKTTFKSMFVNTDSEELKSDLDVKKLYKDIIEKLDIIKSTARYAGFSGADEITARVNNINDGIKLMNQINNNTAYYQIPLNISGYKTTGELYVLKREQTRKRIDPRDVTMFISLDTQNIGRIETVIDIKGKNVSMNLRAEEQQIIEFIKENYKDLYNSLVGKGYRLVDVKYRLIEDETNPVNMERNIKKELDSGRYSLDMRI